MLSVNRLKVCEETFAPEPSIPVHPITQDKCKGLTTLPYELFLEIVAYFPKIPTTAIYCEHDYLPQAIRYRQRFANLRALSQTCKELRGVVLPLVWERFEVCTVEPVLHSSYDKRMASALEKKCKGLLQSPYLIPYVRILTVTFKPYKVDTILPTFAECLQALTNLHTIQIVSIDSEYYSFQRAIKSAFEGRIFPSVRTAILPYAARDILIWCPNVEDVTYNDDVNNESDSFVTRLYIVRSQALCDVLVAAKLTKLKTLRRVVPSKDLIKNMPKIAPNLELIRIFYTLVQPHHLNLLEGLKNFKNLDTIEIQFSSRLCIPRHEIKLEQLKPSLVQIARDVLNASKSTRNKCIRLLYSERLESEEILLY